MARVNHFIRFTPADYSLEEVNDPFWSCICGGWQMEWEYRPKDALRGNRVEARAEFEQHRLGLG